MTLTPRRMETLGVLRSLCDRAAAAVHYSAVAERMGISGWTAYGLLRELEALGLVVRSRPLIATRLRGRSQVLFRPAAPAAAPSASSLRLAFERFVAIRDEVAAATAYLAEPGDVASQLGFWLARLSSAGRQAADAARGVLEGGSEPLVKIQVVAAMGLGSTLARVGQGRLARQVVAAGARFTLLLDDAARRSEEGLAGLVDAARSLEPRHDVVALS